MGPSKFTLGVFVQILALFGQCNTRGNLVDILVIRPMYYLLIDNLNWPDNGTILFTNTRFYLLYTKETCFPPYICTNSPRSIIQFLTLTRTNGHVWWISTGLSIVIEWLHNEKWNKHWKYLHVSLMSNNIRNVP